ncbi:MAG: hypothetical protein RIC19_21175 [Phaeodactylibacter sp.]|uniref:hypothetical protein n=1 Tax=Phaeodactylibacter sp. TaxID=1940289 RepID=UPI0032EBD942
MSVFRTLLIVILTGSLLTGCKPDRTPPAVSCYYWKSTFDLSPAETEWLKRQRVQRIYVKYLDVDIENGQAVPKAPIRFKGEAYQAYEIVPCVFITNRTFQAQVNPDALAEQVWNYLGEINTTYHLSPTTYQLDCDWSPSTQAAYFRFLKRFRQLAEGKTLTATIRLHQLQYPKQTGVPPVDRGVLMYYNMGDIQSVEEPNSILNTNTAATYLTKNMQYDLPLDYALPTFSWVLAYRLGELHAIINQSSCSQLDTMTAVEALGPNRYRMQQNAYFGNHYLNQGDQLRCEAPTTADLETATDQLKLIDNNCEHLLFYHLDENLSNAFPENLPQRLAKRLVTP